MREPIGELINKERAQLIIEQEEQGAGHLNAFNITPLTTDDEVDGPSCKAYSIDINGERGFIFMGDDQAISSAIFYRHNDLSCVPEPIGQETPIGDLIFSSAKNN